MLRGATIHKARATQGRDFTGLRYGNITPTDIDGFIEYQNKCHIFLEAKLKGAPMLYGQKLALERLCNDLQNVKPTLLIICIHETPANEEIDFANSRVEQYFYKGKWASPKNVITAKQIIDYFLNGLKKQEQR